MNRVGALAFLVAWIGGCASLSPHAKFGEVQSAVTTRGETRVEWRGVSEADEKIDAEIRALATQALTADAAVQIALLSNRDLQAIYEELGVAQADLVEAGLLRNPIFEVQYRWPGRPGNPWELHVVQDFMDVFFIPLRRRAAAASVEAAKFKVADAVINHAADTRRAFYRLQGAQQVVDLRVTVMEATEASALVAQRQLEAGNISDLDAANEQVLFEQAKADLIRVEAEALEERERLNELMGLSSLQASAWAIDSRLPEAPASGGEWSVEELESLALSQRLDLESARQKTESLAQVVGLTRTSGLIPTLNVGGHVEREPEGVSTWGPSAEFPIPIFNQGRPAIARADARLRQARQEYLALATRVGAQVRAARNRMLMAARLAEQYKQVMLPLRGMIVEETQLHYNAMQIGPSQLLQAKQNELRAGAAYVGALEDYWVARVDLESAVGGRLPMSLADEPRSSRPAPQHEESSSHGEH